MQKLTLFIFFLWTSCATIFAQIDFNKYTPITCQGEIPHDLTANAKLNYENKAIKIEDSDKGKRRQDDEKEFYLQNNFSIQDFLVSGQVLYNDTFTRYIERIADVLLKDNPSLRKKMRFYTVKSAEVNAFATQEGIVFVNVGLISSAKSEAQIAYVLAHEISHFTESHVLQGFLETRKIVRGEGYYRYQDYYSRLRSFFRYSRDSEYEADEKGWELYSKSPYAKGIVTDVFDMLLYSHIHFDSFPFNANYFEEKNYRFPAAYTKDKVDSLYVDENREDNFSTHPNAKDRKKRAIGMIGKNNVGGELYIVSESTFHSLQKLARYEMLRYYVSNTNFADAYYHSMLLERTYEPGEYIDYMKGMALYGLAKHFNMRGKRRNVILPVKDVQSTPQQFYFFLHQLTNKEMTILALRENAKLGDKYPNSSFFKEVQEDLMRLLIVENKSRPEEFYSSWSITADSLFTDKERKEYYRYAFVDRIEDPLFYQQLQAYETYRGKKDKFYKDDKFSKSLAFEIGKLKGIEISELSLFQPSFQRVTESLTDMPKVDYLAALEEATYLSAEVKTLALANDIKLKFIEKQPEQYTTNSYNMYSNYVNWFTERSNNNMKMVYMENYDGDTISNSETEYLGVVEVQSVVRNYIVKKFHLWEYTFIVFDKKSGEMVFYQSQETDKKYKRKSAKKALSKSFKTLKKNYEEED